jgi:transcriptional regulator with XRE-family HTH domain
MSLYERIAARPGGERALAAARLRRSVLVILHRALKASGLDSQSDLAKCLRVRRSAVNQVFRGDGNVRISTLAEYLHAMGFEADLTLVKAGEMRAAVLENRSPVPAFPNWSASTSVSYAAQHIRPLLDFRLCGDISGQNVRVEARGGPIILIDCNTHFALSGLSSTSPLNETINLSRNLAIAGAAL